MPRSRKPSKLSQLDRLSYAKQINNRHIDDIPKPEGGTSGLSATTKVQVSNFTGIISIYDGFRYGRAKLFNSHPIYIPVDE